MKRDAGLVPLTININTRLSEIGLCVMVCHMAAINAFIRFANIPHVKSTLDFIISIPVTLHRVASQVSDYVSVRNLYGHN